MTRAHYPVRVLCLALAAFLAAFDLAIGRYLMHKCRPDFNLVTGNYLLYGLPLICVAPLLVNWLRPQP